MSPKRFGRCIPMVKCSDTIWNPLLMSRLEAGVIGKDPATLAVDHKTRRTNDGDPKVQKGNIRANCDKVA